MSRQTFRLAPIAMLLVAAGCGSAPTEIADPSGTYALTTINGRPLPGVVSRTSDRTLELLTSTLTLTVDHRFSFSGRFRTTIGDGYVIETTEVATGSWTLRGTTVSIAVDQDVDVGASAMTWAWDGRKTLTIQDPSGSVPVTLVFTR